MSKAYELNVDYLQTESSINPSCVNAPSPSRNDLIIQETAGYKPESLQPDVHHPC